MANLSTQKVSISVKNLCALAGTSVSAYSPGVILLTGPGFSGAYSTAKLVVKLLGSEYTYDRVKVTKLRGTFPIVGKKADVEKAMAKAKK